MDGYAVVAADTTARHATTPVSPAHRRSHLHRPGCRAAASTPARCAEIATGAPLPDGADAVVMVEETARAGDDRVDILAAAARRARTSAGAAPTSRPAISSSAAAIALNPSRIGALAAIGCARRRGVRPAARRDPLDRQRSDRPGQRRSAGGQIYDVNRFTLGAVVAAHGGVAEPHRAGAGHARGARRARSTRARARTHRLLRRQLGRRARSDRRSDRRARRDDLSRHRGEAGQADGVRAGRRRAVLRHARQPDVVPVERLHPARAVPARHRAAAALRAAHGPRAARQRASSRRPAGISSTRSGCATASRIPAFKGSGDITSLSQADGYIEIPADQSTVEEGTVVDVTLF